MLKKGRTHVKVKGLNQERTINNVIKSMKIYNYNRIEHNLCEFEVDYSRHKTLVKMLKEGGLEVEYISHFGTLSFFKRLLTSYGLIVALIFCSLFYFFQYNLVLKIDVFGLDKQNSKRVISFVDDNLNSRFKSRIDTKSLEILVKDNFEEVSSISVAIIGQSLVINVNKAVIPDEMKEGEAIISQYDGLITDITLVQGTLAVDVGDIVQKGDVLVYPYIIDAEGEQRAVTPKAEIYADIWLGESETHYDYYISTIRTGNQFTKSEIYLGKLLIYSNISENPYKQFETKEKSQCISKNNILPLYRKQVVYYETVTKEVIEEFSEVKDQIIEKARQKALIFLQENEIIKDENYTIREDDGGSHKVDYVITVNRNIGG